MYHHRKHTLVRHSASHFAYLLTGLFLFAKHLPLGLMFARLFAVGAHVAYATPALVLIFIYCIGAAAGSNLATVYSAETCHLLPVGRCVPAPALSAPFRLLHSQHFPPAPSPGTSNGNTQRPHSLRFSLRFGVRTVCGSHRALQFGTPHGLHAPVHARQYVPVLPHSAPTVNSISYPDFRQVETPPTKEEITQSEAADFNEANLHRFEVMEYIMQHERPYTDDTFNRERLCRLAGFNRHVALQSLRSQGYNDIHEYISRYRVAELRRLIEMGKVTDLKQVTMVGFRSARTAVVGFERYENLDLSAFLESYVKPDAKRPREAVRNDV